MGNELKVILTMVDNMSEKLTGVSNNLGAFGKRVDSMIGMWAGFGTALGGALAIDQIKNMIVGLMDDAKEYTKIQNQLRESLGYTSLALDDQADALSRQFIIKKQDIQNVQQRIALYTQDENVIKNLTRATLNYASATGKDLLTVTQLVDRAIISENGTMKGLPGKLDGAAESTERLAAISDALNEKMHDQAKAVAESKNIWDKLKVTYENIHQGIAIGIFGTSSEKDLLRYRNVMKEIEDIASGRVDYEGRNKEYLEADLKFADEYKKKMDEERKAAAQHGINYSGSEALNKAMKAQTEEHKKALEEQNKIDKKDKEEEKKWTKQMLDDADHDAKARYENQIKADKMQDELYEKERKAEVENQKQSEEQMRKYWVNRWEEQVQYAEKMASTSMDLGQAMGTSLGAGLGKGREGYKIAFRGMLTDIGGFIEREALAAIAKETLDNFLLGGGIGVLFLGGAEAGAITAIAGAAKSAIQGYQGGTNYAQGGAAWVGESGRELAILPRGTKVVPHGQSVSNSYGGHTLIYNHYDSSGTLHESITAELRSGNADRMVRELVKRMEGLN